MSKKVFISAPRFYGIDEAIKEAFIELGYEAILKNFRTRLTFLEHMARKIGKKSPFLKIFTNLILKLFLIIENREFISFLKRENPGLVFVVKGEHLFSNTLKRIRKSIKAPLIAYIWDDPFYSYAGQFSDDYRMKNFEEGMGYYNYIFVYDPFYVRKMRSMGVNNVEYLPLAADPKRYHSIALTENEKGYDICFVGYPFPNRVALLNNLSKFNLGVFGDGWIQTFISKGESPPSYYKGKAQGEEVVKLYLSSKIVLNIHDPEAIEGLNTRTFDILSCGAFEIVDAKSELEKQFNVGEEIISYKDPEELLKKIEYYLNNPGLRAIIAQKGKEKVLACHTWRKRIESALNVLAQKGIINDKVD